MWNFFYGTNGSRECPFYHYSTTSEMESMIGAHKFKYGNSSAETKKRDQKEANIPKTNLFKEDQMMVNNT